MGTLSSSIRAAAAMDLAPPTVRVTEQTRERIAWREAVQAQALVDETVVTGTTPSSGSRCAGAEFTQVLPSHPVGARCEVGPGNRRGVVRFVGCPGGIPHPLVAVELDEPLGPDRQV